MPIILFLQPSSTIPGEESRKSKITQLDSGVEQHRGGRGLNELVISHPGRQEEKIQSGDQV